MLKWSVLTPNVLAASSSTWSALLGRSPFLFRTLNLIAMALQLILASFGSDVIFFLSLLCHICNFQVFLHVFFLLSDFISLATDSDLNFAAFGVLKNVDILSLSL